MKPPKDSPVRDRWSRRRVGPKDHPFLDEHATQQQFVVECDINRIVSNAKRGIAPRFGQRGHARFGDFSNVPDFNKAFDLVSRAREAFMDFPAALRLELGNDFRNINLLTSEQISRFGLDRKAKATPDAAPSLPPSGAGQATPDGGVPPTKADKAAKTE